MHVEALCCSFPLLLSLLILALPLVASQSSASCASSGFNEWAILRPSTQSSSPALAGHTAAPLVLPLNANNSVPEGYFFSSSSSYSSSPSFTSSAGSMCNENRAQAISLYMLVFGGYHQSGDTQIYSNDLWLFSLIEGWWTKFEYSPLLPALSAGPATSWPMCSSARSGSPSSFPSSSPSSPSVVPCAPFLVAANTPSWVSFGLPPARFGHIMGSLIWGDGEYLVCVVFGGGETRWGPFFGDTWLWQYTPNVLHADYNTAWLNITPPASNSAGMVSPTAQSFSSSTTFRNCLYMTGGFLGNMDFDYSDMSVWRFALLSPSFGVWTLLISSIGLPGLSLASFGIYSLGGVDYFLLSGGYDVVRLTVSTSMWNAPVPILPSAGTGPCAWPNASAACIIPGPFSNYMPPTTSSWSLLPQPGPALGMGSTIRAMAGSGEELVWMLGMSLGMFSEFSILNLAFVMPNTALRFDAAALAWQPLASGSSTGNNPGSIAMFSTVVFGNNVVLYGGENTFTQDLSQGVYSAMIFGDSAKTPLVWQEDIVAVSPEARYFAQSIFLHGRFYVLGGQLQISSCASDMWQFDPAVQVWSQLPISNIAPVLGGSVVCYRGVLYTFGGLYQFINGSQLVYPTVGSVDVVAMTFAVVLPSTALMPPGRLLHSAVVYEDAMYIFGGGNCSINTGIQEECSIFGDLWSFNFTSTTWLQHLPAIPSEKWPTARYQHTATVLLTSAGTAMYVFGGLSSEAAPAEVDLWAYIFKLGLWQQLSPSLTSAFPAPRFGHFAIAIGSSSFSVASTSTTLQIFNGLSVTPSGPITALMDSWVYNAITNRWTRVFNADWITSTLAEGIAYGYDAQSNTILAFGGLQNAFTVNLPTSPSNQLVTLQLGCSPGSFSANYSTQPCLPCPLGTYASVAGVVSCVPCPAQISTRTTGSTMLSQCSVCRPDLTVCAHGSVCRVETLSTGLSPICTDCPFPYSGATCNIYSAGLYVAIFVPLVLAVAIVVMWRVQRARAVEQVRRRKEEELNMQVQEAQAVFCVDYQNLVMKADENSAGEGASGKVIRGTYWGMPVAIKLLINVEQLAAASEEELMLKKQSFAEEGKTLASLHHANIVRYFGTSSDPQDNLLLVMEFCDRGSLFDVLRKQPEAAGFGWRELWGFAYDCSKGMAFLHSRGRAHNDLKSLNLFVSENWVVKVGDFGDAEKLSGRASGPTSGSGTLLWKAPERMRGYVGRLRADLPGASDVYSFGVVMWEIGAPGKLPYEHLRFNSQIEIGVAEGTLRPDLAAMLPSAVIPPAYRMLMQRAWAQNPEDRPTFEEAMQDLEAMTVVVVQGDGTRLGSGGIAQHLSGGNAGGAGHGHVEAEGVTGGSVGDGVSRTRTGGRGMASRVRTTPVHLRSGGGRGAMGDNSVGAGSGVGGVGVGRVLSEGMGQAGGRRGKGKGQQYEMSELLLPRDGGDMA